jgi:hypothetical protein
MTQSAQVAHKCRDVGLARGGQTEQSNFVHQGGAWASWWTLQFPKLLEEFFVA